MQDATTAWLIGTLFGGESATWERLRTAGADAGQAAELVRLASMPDQPLDREAVETCSAALRRVCVAAPSAESAIAIASATMLRLSALGHEDPAWVGLMPRWLVAGLDGEVRGLGLLALAVSSCDRLACEDYSAMVEEALGLLPAESHLRIAHLRQFALYLGLRGMLQRLCGVLDLPRPGDSEPEVEPSLLAECFYDAVCCGRTAQAAFLSRRIASTPEVAWQAGLTQLHQLYIPVFAAVIGDHPLPADAAAPSAPVIRALLDDDHGFLEAYDLASVRGEASPLLGYDSLRVALARHDLVVARRLLDERSAGAESHWLDDLFLARLLLLEDRSREAGAVFAKIEAAAQRYGATERIEIELRLARELNRHDCFRLGLAAGMAQGRSGTVAAARQAGSPDNALLLGSSRAAGDLRQALERAVTDAPRWLLAVGPNDGSLRALTGILTARWGGGPSRRMSATSSAAPGWMDRCLEHLRLAGLAPNGCLIIDDLEFLSPDVQAQLLDLLDGPEGGPACRVVCTASHALEAAVESERWRKDLFWLLAGNRLRIPAMPERGADIGDISRMLLRTFGSSARFEIPATQALAAHPMSGGWAQLRAACRVLAAIRPRGTIDLRAVNQTILSLTSGVPAEAG